MRFALLFLAVIVSLTLSAQTLYAATFYVATSGVDQASSGTLQNPWASISYAVDQVSDGDTIEVAAGTYSSRVRLDQQFANGIVIRSTQPYQARLRYDDGAVVICYTCQGVVLEGFDIAHAGGNNGALVVHIQDLLGAFNGSNNGSDAVVSNVTLRNNIIHDSTNNDLLKINNGAQDILVEGNMFYNQAGSDEHIDVNSTVGVTIQDNVFFNSTSQAITSSFIVIKDSNGANDTVLGTQDTLVRRNIFFNWQGNDAQSFIRIGEDGTANFEADGVLVENNLFLGNSNRLMRSAFTVQGSRDVRFQYNTITGNLPSRSYAARLLAVGPNQPNEQIVLVNNIWADPGGTMGAEGFNGSDVFDATAEDNASVSVDNNVYYNGVNSIPADATQAVNLADDVNAIIGNPLLPTLIGLTLPVFNGSQFAGGKSSIREVFIDFANRYGKPAIASVAINQGSLTNAPGDDLLGNIRGSSPDVGALELTSSEPPFINDDMCFPVTASSSATVIVCL
ncbi:MAG: hypothetical protein ACRBHB_17430 [Arenicella sp.]